MTATWILLGLSLACWALFLYPYLIYPRILKLWSEQPVRQGPVQLSVSLLFCAHNEMACLPAKLEKDLALFEDGRVLKLRYEDFVQNPEEYVRRICRHCGLPMADEMTEFVRATVKTDRNLKWQRFDPQQLERILPEVSDQMARNGYELPDEIGESASKP